MTTKKKGRAARVPRSKPAARKVPREVTTRTRDGHLYRFRVVDGFIERQTFGSSEWTRTAMEPRHIRLIYRLLQKPTRAA